MYEPKHYRAIMLSSTFTDLEKHRKEVIKAIDKFGYRANVMENDGARANVDVVESSLQMVRDSAAYIGVISRKYGQTPLHPQQNPGRLSITELEFNEADRLGRPIVLFIMGERHPVTEADVELDPDKRQKLHDFRERAKHMQEGSEINRVYEVFESLEQFSTATAIAVGRLAQNLAAREFPQHPAAAPIQSQALSNVPVSVPRHFLGRDEDLAAIDSAFEEKKGRVAVVALHGLRGVGKTTLAAAYAERHQGDYRVTWWIRAETEATMRADLVGLGVRLEWVVQSEQEDLALAKVMERLRGQGNGILLVYDNVPDASALKKFLPRGSTARIIVTSNAPNLRGVAAPVKIEVWPKETGAAYLIERTGRSEEYEAGLALSDALGGLPLALEQAAAYCDDLGIPIGEYQRRFAAATMTFLENPAYAPVDYHPEHAASESDRLTVAGTFRVAIEEAAKRNPAAEPLIVHAALLGPEPIPLFVFLEGAEKLGVPFAALPANDGLDRAIAALRAFALVDREAIPDERDPAVATDCIRLHRLVRQVAAARRDHTAIGEIRRKLITALAAIYPANVLSDPTTWPRARRLDPLVMALVGDDAADAKGLETEVSYLLDRLAFFRQGSLGAYAQARPLFERALAIHEETLGPDHPDTARSLNYLGDLLNAQGDLNRARYYYERALAIRETALGPNDPETAESLSGVGYQRQAAGDFAGARSYYERALVIREQALGGDHPDTALSLNNLGYLLRAQHNLAGARPYYERALAIKEQALGPVHPGTALSLNNLGYLKQLQGDLVGARADCERAVGIYQQALGPDHPDTARALDNLGVVLRKQGDAAGALVHCRRGLAIFEKAFGPGHPDTVSSARNTAMALNALGRTDEANALRDQYGLEPPWFARIGKWLSRSLDQPSL